MRTFIVPAAALAGALATASAFAQGTPPAQGSMPGMPMQHKHQGQQGGMMINCPMMQRMASLDTRLRQLEERAGIPSPPAPSSAPR